MAAVSLEHMSQRNTAPNFQGKHAQTTCSPLKDLGGPKAKLKALTSVGVVLPESTVCGPFNDCPGLHSPSKTVFESRKLTLLSFLMQDFEVLGAADLLVQALSL